MGPAMHFVLKESFLLCKKIPQIFSKYNRWGGEPMLAQSIRQPLQVRHWPTIEPRNET